jgi:hypothetical protein
MCKHRTISYGDLNSFRFGYLSLCVMGDVLEPVSQGFTGMTVCFSSLIFYIVLIYGVQCDVLIHVTLCNDQVGVISISVLLNTYFFGVRIFKITVVAILVYNTVLLTQSAHSCCFPPEPSLVHGVAGFAQGIRKSNFVGLRTPGMAQPITAELGMRATSRLPRWEGIVRCHSSCRQAPPTPLPLPDFLTLDGFLRYKPLSAISSP